MKYTYPCAHSILLHPVIQPDFPHLPSRVKWLHFLLKICRSLYYQANLIIRQTYCHPNMCTTNGEIRDCESGIPGIATGMGTFHVHWTFPVLPHLTYASCVTQHTSAISFIHSYSVIYLSRSQSLRALPLELTQLFKYPTYVPPRRSSTS